MKRFLPFPHYCRQTRTAAIAAWLLHLTLKTSGNASAYGVFEFTTIALAVEIGYAFLVWLRATRRWIVLATIGMHAGIAVVLGLWSFSALMIVLNAAAFLSVISAPRVFVQPSSAAA